MLPRALVLFVTFVLASILIARAGESGRVPERASFAAFPLELGSWQGRQLPAFDDGTLTTLGVDDYMARAYAREQSLAGLYVGYWASQREGDTIHSPLNCLPGSGWEPVSKRTLAIQIADASPASAARSISVNRYVVRKGLDRELVLYWYQSHGRVVASEYAGKFFLVADALRLHRTDAALVRVMMGIDDDEGGEARAERDGVSFVRTLFPALAPYLPA